MPERCTCGAVLPADALFCHKCGKPQREQLVPEVEPEPVAPPPLPAIAAPPPIGFHNGPAVRVALVAGVLSIVVTFLTVQMAPLRPLALVWPIGTGVLAVFLYRRATGQRLTPLNGAHLGWICGIFGFLMITVLLTMMTVALSEPGVVSTMQDQLKDRGMSDADVNQLVQSIGVLRSPAGIASWLSMSFLLFTVLPAFGGLIGAKLLDRD